MKDAIDSIAAVLNQTNDVLIKKSRNQLLHRVAGTLSEYLGKKAKLMRKFKSLSTHSVGRIISAPETFRHLLMYEMKTFDSGVEQFFNTAFDIELNAKKMSSLHTTALWSALGDISVEPEQSNGTRNVVRQSFLHGIVIDGASPAVTRKPLVASEKDWKFNSVRKPSTAEYSRAFKKISQAFDLLATQSKSYLYLVREHTKIIVLCSDKDDYFTSASCNAEIGRTTLYNAHLETVTVAHITTALVHEAIHSFLYCVEQNCPFTTVEPDNDTTTMTSPWTGGKLNLHSYIHAFFVWWGIVRLWENSVILNDTETIHVANEIVEKASKGFKSERILSDLSVRVNEVSPELFNFIRATYSEYENYDSVVPWN